MKKISFWSLALCLGLMVFVFADQQEEPVIGSEAPAFTLRCGGGGAHSLADYRGKIVVLEWTNPGCPFVVRHYEKGLMPALQKEAKEKGVVWLLINSTNPEHKDYKTQAEMKEIFGAWQAAAAKQFLDADGAVGKAYGAKTTPHLFVINAEGILVYSGAVDDDPRGENEERRVYLKEALEALLSGNEIEVGSTQPYGCTVKYQ